MIKNQNHLGGICMILSVLFFSLMDVLIKITNEYDVGQVMFSRALFGLIPIFFLIPKKKLKYFYKTKRVKLHCLRAGVGTIGMWSIFVGLRNLELAEVTSIAFSGPIWVVITFTATVSAFSRDNSRDLLVFCLIPKTTNPPYKFLHNIF